MCGSHFPPISVFFPYSRSYIVHFSFFMFFNVSHDIPCLRVFLSHFSHISDFLPYSRSYSVNFSFFKFFRITCHISRPTVCVSYIHNIEFIAIFQVLQCLCLIFLVCHCSGYIHFSFSVFVSFSPFF